MRGKSAGLVTQDRFARVAPGDDPGFDHKQGRLYVFAGDEDEGLVTLCYEVDEARDCSIDVVEIVSQTTVYLPLAFQGFDVRATPTFLPPSQTQAGSR